MSRNRHVAAAQKHMRKGRYKKAIAEYDKVVKETPEDVRARLTLANLQLRNGQKEQAVETFLQAARIYEQKGAALKAIAVYKQLLKLVADREDVCMALARNYREHGLPHEAASQYRQALDILERKKKEAEKLDVVREILDLDPNNIPDRLRLAEAYSAHGRITDAAREFRKVASALERMGYREDYQRVAERLLYHQPEEVATARKLAMSYVDSGEPQRALPKLKIAFRSAPTDVEVLGCLAETFKQLGQAPKAVTVLKEMARIYERNGLEQERDDCYQSVLELDADDEEAREAVAPMREAADETIEFEEDESAAEVASARAAEAARTPTGRRRTGRRVQAEAARTAQMSEDERQHAEQLSRVASDEPSAGEEPPPPPVEPAAPPSEPPPAQSPEAAEPPPAASQPPDASAGGPAGAGRGAVRPAPAATADREGGASAPPPPPQEGARPEAGRAGGAEPPSSSEDIDRLIADSMEPEQESGGAASVAPSSDGGAGSDVEALFQAALREVGGDPEQATGMETGGDGDVDLDADFEMEEDEVGFEEGGESTLVDDGPPAPGLGESLGGEDGFRMPERSSDEQAASAPPTDPKLREELQELDFYIANGLGDEARVLLAELQQTHARDPEVEKRAQQIARMA